MECIANKTGATFENNSSSQNYFPDYKPTEVENPSNFTTKHPELSYDINFV